MIEMTQNPIIQSYIPLVKGIAATFGSRCEVALHDFSNLQHSIIAIENGHVTGRSPGSPMTESSLKMVQNDKVDEDIINYTGKSADGRVLKSTTVFIKDDHQKVIGCFCINFDITELVAAKSVLNDIMKISEDFEDRQKDVKNLNVVSIVLTDLVKDTLDEVGKPIIYLSKDDKVMMVDRLDQKGAFLIKGAIDYVANVLCVSRYTIYNYLDEIRETK
jgi:predicted transcriptional regulator YheO